jgi:gentisate 1,2-dioxygenase
MQTTATPAEPVKSPERKELYARLEKKNAEPLWEVLSRLVLPEPQPACEAVLWKYDDLRPLLMDAGKVISAKEAERRVLILVNPGLKGKSQITQSLYAGLQLVLPGEVAPSHKHTASALRFVLEGDGGAYTAVDGERTMMRTGDFVLTPSGCFHDHGNPGTTPVIWLDGLDIPIVNAFDTSFDDHHDEEMQPITRPNDDAVYRYGHMMLPVEYKQSGLSAPTFTYPYERSREALDHLGKNGPIHPVHGVKMQYVNPVTGSYPIPTIAAFLQLLPRGFHGKSYRSTDSTVFCAAEGHGTSQIGDQSIAWGPHDIFVAPSWKPVSHSAQEESVLFSFSDRAAQKALGLWREAY